MWQLRKGAAAADQMVMIKLFVQLSGCSVIRSGASQCDLPHYLVDTLVAKLVLFGLVRTRDGNWRLQITLMCLLWARLRIKTGD